MEKVLNNNVPDGCEIDKENTTFDKIDDVVIKWNASTYAVEIAADGEHFMVDASRPSYYCSWDDAMRFHRNGIWNLPTVKQLKVLAKHINKVNEVIQENNEFEIAGGWLWSHEEKDKSRVWSVYMDDGGIYGGSKDRLTYVRAVCVL